MYVLSSVSSTRYSERWSSAQSPCRFSIISIKLKIAQIPNNSNWASLYGVGILTGIGFTMSLFIGNLAFVENTQYISGVKIGVLAGSLLSTLFGYFLLLITSKK